MSTKKHGNYSPEHSGTFCMAHVQYVQIITGLRDERMAKIASYFTDRLILAYNFVSFYVF